MARRYGRCLRGQRQYSAVPQGHWETTAFIAGLRLTGIVAPMVLDGSINGRSFQVYVDRVLIPDQRPGDIVIMDNLGSHKGPGIQAAIEAAERTRAALCDRIGTMIDQVLTNNAQTFLQLLDMSQIERKIF